ncbi:MAG: nucleotide exchange factor GrpE [Patescibacteria group bacterium]
MTEDTTPPAGQTQDDPMLALQAELAAMTETAKRAMADLQNFKRRTEEERGEIQVYANMRLLEAIFPALDNFARAFEIIPEDLEEEEWVKGIQGIESNLMNALAALGLESIDQIGIPADPNKHEVLMEGEGAAGQVVQIFEKGYAFKGKTIRPAKVQVGRS